MNRRELLAAVAASGFAGPVLAQGQDMRAAARDAWIYALPLIEMGAARTRTQRDRPQNTLFHNRALSDHTARFITTPNNDTLYSSAWLDLTQGPVTLTTPDFGGRYWSAAVMDMFTNNNAVLGTRTVGGAATRITLVGPGHASPGSGALRVATPHAWLLVRILVDGPDDLPAVHALQDALVLDGPKTAAPAALASRDAPAGDYFFAANSLLRSDGFPPTDLRLIRRAQGLLSPPVMEARPSPASAEVEAGVADAKAILAMGRDRPAFIKGWNYPRPNLGDFGQDYLYRAGVAMWGLAALPVAEAMYMRAEGEGGGLFKGDGLYRFTMPAKVPLDGFWSLSLYEPVEGQFFFTDNVLKRYAIGDRTAGLKRNADGSVDIWISREDPGAERRSNWLPAPKSGGFSLFLRTYLPRAELIDGRFRFEPVTRI